MPYLSVCALAKREIEVGILFLCWLNKLLLCRGAKILQKKQVGRIDIRIIFIKSGVKIALGDEEKIGVGLPFHFSLPSTR